MRPTAAAALCGLALAAAGCGLKGPLYLPDKSGEVVVRPAPGATPATTPTQPATTSPATPAEPPPPSTPPGGSGARG